MARTLRSREARKLFREKALFGFLPTPLRIFCEKCDKYIPSTMLWVCGYCGTENKTTSLYSFLHRCAKCKRIPKSVQCPHCEALNFLGKATEDTHPAKNLFIAPPPETEEMLRTKKRNLRADAKEDLQHEIEITRLNADLAKLKGLTSEGEEKEILERIRKNGMRFFAEKIGVFQFKQEMKKVCAEKFKDDPEMLERCEDVLQSFVEQES